MISVLATGGGWMIKIATSGGSGGASQERQIGFATKLDWTVNNGQKMIYVVDSPFPAEIAQGADRSYVSGTMTIYMPRVLTIESANLSPFRHDAQGQPVGPFTNYSSIRIYDRQSRGLILSLDYCKFSKYSVSAAARQVVMANIQFEGILASPGQSNL